MKVDEEDFRRRYAELSDEGLLKVDREDLVETARRCYDEELMRRGFERGHIAGGEPEDDEDGTSTKPVSCPPAHTGAIAAKRTPRVNRWLLKMAFGVAGGLAITACLLYQRHQEHAHQLYDEAFSIGTDQSVSAVKRLAALQGERTTAMLLDLALKLRPMDSGAFARVAAIEALADRHDSRVAPALARLLQPHIEQPVRKAVADALRKLQCVGDCTASVLHYLERTSRGDANIEDRRTPRVAGQEQFWDGVRAMLVTDERAVYDSLYTALQQQGAATTQVLVTVYGLGTDAPSKFALEIASRTRLVDACPALLHSRGELGKSESRNHERDDVSAAIQAVGCK